MTLAKNLADRVAKGLSSKYGCVLGEGQINKRHELGIDDPVANLLNRYFTVSLSGLSMIAQEKTRASLTILTVTLLSSIC